MRLAHDNHFSVRWAVADSLGKYDCSENISVLAKLARKMKLGPALDALVNFSTNTMAAEAIKGLSRARNSCLRANLASRLDEWRHRDAPVLLRQLAHNKDSCVRCAAVSALGALRLSKDFPLLRRMTGDCNAWVRREAVWAIGHYPPNSKA
jgi:HEAT repeat protein